MLVFSKNWFLKHQRPLLTLANTWFGRRFFRITGDVPKGKRLIGILPNSITWGNDDETLTTDFRTNDKFARRLYFGLKPLWDVLHAWDTLTHQVPAFNLGFDSLTQYPNSTAEDNPVDGTVERSGVDESFATIRAAAGTGNQESSGLGTSTFFFAYLYSTATTNQFSRLIRSIICFDTSALGAGATISAAVLSLVGDASSVNNFGGSTLHIAGATPSSTTALANADFGQCQTTSFGNVAFASWNIGSYSDITLNSSGRSNISQTGISKFSAQLGWDILSSFDASWIINSNSGFYGSHANRTGTTEDPKLVVTYTAGTAYTQGPADTITMSDSVQTLFSGNYTRTVSDTITMSDSVTTSSTNVPRIGDKAQTFIKPDDQ